MNNEAIVIIWAAATLIAGLSFVAWAINQCIDKKL